MKIKDILVTLGGCFGLGIRCFVLWLVWRVVMIMVVFIYVIFLVFIVIFLVGLVLWDRREIEDL